MEPLDALGVLVVEVQKSMDLVSRLTGLAYPNERAQQLQTAVNVLKKTVGSKEKGQETDDNTPELPTPE